MILSCPYNAGLQPRRLSIAPGRRRLQADVGRRGKITACRADVRRRQPAQISAIDCSMPRERCDFSGAWHFMAIIRIPICERQT